VQAATSTAMCADQVYFAIHDTAANPHARGSLKLNGCPVLRTTNLAVVPPYTGSTRGQFSYTYSTLTKEFTWAVSGDNGDYSTCNGIHIHGPVTNPNNLAVSGGVLDILGTSPANIVTGGVIRVAPATDTALCSGSAYVAIHDTLANPHARASLSTLTCPTVRSVNLAVVPPYTGSSRGTLNWAYDSPNKLFQWNVYGSSGDYVNITGIHLHGPVTNPDDVTVSGGLLWSLGPNELSGTVTVDANTDGALCSGKAYLAIHDVLANPHARGSLKVENCAASSSNPSGTPSATISGPPAGGLTSAEIAVLVVCIILFVILVIIIVIIIRARSRAGGSGGDGGYKLYDNK